MLLDLLLHLLTTVKLILQLEVALLVQSLKIVLQEFQSLHDRLVGVVLVQETVKLLFVVFRNALVKNCYDCSLLWVLTSVDLNFKEVLLELKVQVYLLLEEEGAHFDCEMEEISLEGGKRISKFSNYLVVLLLGGIFETVDDV